jgi:carbonic anhydrase/acetyltransferase-like protein (isoleucine patch superfamily)
MKNPIKTLIKKCASKYSCFGSIAPSSVFHVKKGNRFLNPRYIKIGESVLLSSNSLYECYPAPLSDVKGDPVLSIGDRTCIRSYCHFQCANSITIGKDVLISDFVYICDYNHGLVPNKSGYHDGKLESAPVSIGDGCWIGHGVSILKGVSIGQYCVIGANSVVTKNVPDYCMAVGNPAKVIKVFDSKTTSWNRLGSK